MHQNRRKEPATKGKALDKYYTKKEDYTLYSGQYR